MEEESRRGGIAGMLTRRVGPLPIWIYAVIGILGLAWYLRAKAAKNAKTQGAAVDASALAAGATGTFPNAQPMNYSSDIFVNLTQPGPQGPPGPPGTPPPQQTSITYVVQTGDTLFSIAQKTLGSGDRWPEILGANRSILDATARQRGMTSSDNGHWIFGGEALVIPA